MTLKTMTLFIVFVTHSKYFLQSPILCLSFHIEFMEAYMCGSISDKPGPPRDLRATTVTEDSVTLTWLAPSDNGGSDVTSYVVEKREALRMTWQPVGTTSDTTIAVPNLSEGVQYVFRVSAVNKVGTGAPEELSRAIAAKSPHCK